MLEEYLGLSDARKPRRGWDAESDEDDSEEGHA
jgi:hypothetical protein